MSAREPRDASVLVVGASAAGLATAESLRRLGHSGPLALVDAEEVPPYDRPPLSKQFLSGEWDADRVVLREASALQALNADFHLGERARRLDAGSRTVETESGRRLVADSIVIATGLRARWLPGERSLAGVHTLRTLNDAVSLRGRLEEDGPVVVVGNGVLGSEIAVAAATRGRRTTLVGSSVLPMAPQLGAAAASLLARRHEEAGMRLIGGARVTGIRGSAGRVKSVVLDTGDELPASTVVVAIGSDPQTAWLENSGLRLDDGVLCDETCRAADGIWAVGDVARWQHVGLGKSIRLENRTNATEQALSVARAVLGEPAPYTPMPYFWTDQHGSRIQVYGTMSDADNVTVVEGDPTEGKYVAVATRGGDPLGVLGWGMPKQARQHTRPLLDHIKNRTAEALSRAA